MQPRITYTCPALAAGHHPGSRYAASSSMIHLWLEGVKCLACFPALLAVTVSQRVLCCARLGCQAGLGMPFVPIQRLQAASCVELLQTPAMLSRQGHQMSYCVHIILSSTWCPDAQGSYSQYQLANLPNPWAFHPAEHSVQPNCPPGPWGNPFSHPQPWHQPRPWQEPQVTSWHQATNTCCMTPMHVSLCCTLL